MVPKNAATQACSNFFDAAQVINGLRPKVLLGLSTIIKIEPSKYLGSSMLTNKMDLSSVYPSGYRFGISCIGNQNTKEKLVRYIFSNHIFNLKKSMQTCNILFEYCTKLNGSHFPQNNR